MMIVITNTENDTLPAKCDVHPWARAVGRTVGSEYRSNIRTQKQFGKKRNCESIKAQFRWLQKGWVCPGQAGGHDCPLHCGHVRDGWWLGGESLAIVKLQTQQSQQSCICTSFLHHPRQDLTSVTNIVLMSCPCRLGIRIWERGGDTLLNGDSKKTRAVTNFCLICFV